MAAATVAINQGRVAPLMTVSVIPITVSYSATAYATASGGLPFDLYATLTQASPFTARINYQDIISLVPLGPTVEKFTVGAFAVGTATASTLPCTVRLYGTGSANKAALTEVDDANLTGSFKAELHIARGGTQ